MIGRGTHPDQDPPGLDRLVKELARAAAEHVDSGRSTGIAAGVG